MIKRPSSFGAEEVGGYIGYHTLLKLESILQAQNYLLRPKFCNHLQTTVSSWVIAGTAE